MNNTFNNTETWGQCYKNFYHGNLPPFHNNAAILCYKTMLPLYNHRMAINYHIKSFITLAQGKLKYQNNLPFYFNPRKSRVNITAVNYGCMFIALAQGRL
jgi:hypothetical protein